jgi:ankyrin repeat protein
MSMRIKLLTALCLAAVALPASAQFANTGYSFLQAVRERDGSKVTEMLDAPGSTVINFRDDKGEGALHVLAGRRDLQWMSFLIGKKADVNLGNRTGDTPLIIAARIGFLEGVDLLLRSRAQVDRANRLGETALIIAVQQRQIPVVRRLVEAGADPNRTDNATGRNARDYARLDARGAEMIRVMDQAKPKPKAAVAGPKL